MTTWAKLFAPVAALGRDHREGQAKLGEAIIHSISTGESLLAEAQTGTGKSFAALIPTIAAAQQAHTLRKNFKGVVSTETLTLQSQLIDKDLPFLAGLYPGFTYRKLMGRSNYVCLNQARLNSRGNLGISALVEKLKLRQANLGDGELRDAERVIGRELTPEEWGNLTGSSKFCGDNQCDPEKCYSTLARNKAMTADIVVVNHALLATDIEMKVSSGGGAFSDGLLGQIDVLIVDEGHKLEPVLVDQWTKTLGDWELREMSASVQDGIDQGRNLVRNLSIGADTAKALESLEDVLKNIRRFFSGLTEKAGEDWAKASHALALKTLSGNDPAHLLAMMREFEEENPVRLKKSEQVLEEAIKYLTQVAVRAAEEQSSGRRKINKGLRAAKDLLEAVRIISKALETKDGIVSQYGTFGAIVDGWKRNNGENGMTIRLVPLDVSVRAKAIWKEVRVSILLSATLTDLTDGTLRYARECVGFPPGAELKVGTPFDLMNQQLVYVTVAQGEKADVGRAQFNMDELVKLLTISRGRALVLFTSREELDWAAYQMTNLYATGAFPYRVLVQTKDANKGKLAEEFKSDTHSVLFATKSFFTGFDAPGETLSLVVMCKFPLPRWSVECRQQVAHWRKRGFPNWYTRSALTDLEQAFGRLIRSSGCKGVLALLDMRAMDAGSNVYKTASLGVSAIGSPVTQDLTLVQQFLS